MPSLLPDYTYESRHQGWVAGVDEVGRGVLAGPVIAAAVILTSDAIPDGLHDSKQLKAPQREVLYHKLTSGGCVSYAIGSASVEEVDTLNIYHASLLAMQRAVAGLSVAPIHILIDGKALPKQLPCTAEAIIKGDSRCFSIAAASIIAKVTRDRLMSALAQEHPGYGWEHNAGYSTAKHMAALQTLGVTPHHRRSFRPVREAIEAAYAAA